MTNEIGTYIVSQLSSVISIMLTEDESTQHPYAVYALELSEETTKAGPYKLSGTLEIYVYADTYATLKSKSDSIRSTLATALRTEKFRGSLRSSSNRCDDGIWSCSLEYAVAQYNVQTITNS
ncbi:MAG: hypothetical protein MJY60_04195 [Bacteroidales bacterium]|nr:hypothetical protein [Bacteroidales bacterium]